MWWDGDAHGVEADMNPGGRPPDPRRAAYVDKFGIVVESIKRLDHRLPRRLLDQLDACDSDIERRIILGVSHQKDTPQSDIEEPPSPERPAGETRMRKALWYGFGRVTKSVFRPRQ